MHPSLALLYRSLNLYRVQYVHSFLQDAFQNYTVLAILFVSIKIVNQHFVEIHHQIDCLLELMNKLLKLRYMG